MARQLGWLAVLAVAEAIALFALLFAVASGSVLQSLGLIAAIVLLCVVALRLVDIDTFRWIPARAALGLLALLNALGAVVLVGDALS